jgi:hypothetical protein
MALRETAYIKAGVEMEAQAVAEAVKHTEAEARAAAITLSTALG